MKHKKELIDGLNEDLNLELEAVLRHLYYSAQATGLLGHELREALQGEAAKELGHAAYLADKITALGGELRIDVKMPKKVKSAKEMLQASIAAERAIIANYSERIRQAGEADEAGLVIRLENMISEETDHAEELERLAR